MATLTQNGIEIVDQATILDTLTTQFKNIYGQDLDCAPDTPDGQLLGIWSQIAADNEELALAFYRNLDPDYATGAWLDQVCAYAGIERKQGSYGKIQNVIVTASAATTIAKGTRAVHDNIEWTFDADVKITNPKVSATARLTCSAIGVNAVLSGSEFELISANPAILRIVAQQASSGGAEVETDLQLRKRFYKARHANSQSSTARMIEELESVDGIERAIVLDNPTNATVNSIPAYGIRVILHGSGDSDAIATAIYNTKPAGVPMQGSTSIKKVFDGATRTLAWTYTTPKDLYLKIQLTRYEATNIDTVAIQQACASLDLPYGVNVHASKFYSAIQSNTTAWITKCKLSTSATGSEVDSVAINTANYPRILAANVIIEVI